MNIILASASPRRKELLEQLGLEFQICPSSCEEVISKTIPNEVVKELAKQKAYDIAKYQRDEYLIIGSDTIVTYQGHIMGKPTSEQHAIEMLSTLQGRTHDVYTGVCVLVKRDDVEKEYLFADSTKVKMYPMTNSEINAYVSTGEPMDKAGAYAIQGICAKYIKCIKGDYNNVVGLPIGRLWQEVLVNEL